MNHLKKLTSWNSVLHISSICLLMPQFSAKVKVKQTTWETIVCQDLLQEPFVNYFRYYKSVRSKRPVDSSHIAVSVLENCQECKDSDRTIINLRLSTCQHQGYISKELLYFLQICNKNWLFTNILLITAFINHSKLKSLRITQNIGDVIFLVLPLLLLLSELLCFRLTQEQD